MQQSIPVETLQSLRLESAIRGSVRREILQVFRRNVINLTAHGVFGAMSQIMYGNVMRRATSAEVMRELRAMVSNGWLTFDTRYARYFLAQGDATR